MHHVQLRIRLTACVMIFMIYGVCHKLVWLTKHACAVVSQIERATGIYQLFCACWNAESPFPQNRLPQFIIHLIREWLFPELQKNQKQSQLPPCCITVSAIDLAKSVMCLLLKLDSKSLSQMLFFFLQLHPLVIMYSFTLEEI